MGEPEVGRDGKAVDCDTLYFERKGENVKKLIEEAIPISRLGLHLTRTADDIYIQCLAGNQPYDAVLEVSSFHNLTMKIEATPTETDDSKTRCQALPRNGFAYTAGSIDRKGRNLMLEPEFVDMLEQEKEWAALAFKRLLNKLEKCYGSDTAILVNVETWSPISLDVRAELSRKTQSHLFSHNSGIYGVYYS